MKKITLYFTLLCYMYFTLASHITKIQRVEMNHGLMLHLNMGGAILVIILVSVLFLEVPAFQKI